MRPFLDMRRFVLLMLLHTYTHAGSMDSAMEALAVSMADADAWFDMATALMESKQNQEAAHCLGKVVYLNPAHTGAQSLLNRGMKEGDRKRLLKTTAEFFGDLAEGAYGEALEAKSKRQISTAVSQLRQAIAMNPAHEQALCTLGTILQQHGDDNGAEVLYRQAANSNPFGTTASTLLAALYLERGDFGAAVAANYACLAVNKLDADAWFNLGSALMGSEKTQDARPCFGKALYLNPAHVGARDNLSQGLSEEESTTVADFFGESPGKAHLQRVLPAGRMMGTVFPASSTQGFELQYTLQLDIQRFLTHFSNASQVVVTASLNAGKWSTAKSFKVKDIPPAQTVLTISNLMEAPILQPGVHTVIWRVSLMDENDDEIALGGDEILAYQFSTVAPEATVELQSPVPLPGPVIEFYVTHNTAFWTLHQQGQAKLCASVWNKQSGTVVDDCNPEFTSEGRAKFSLEWTAYAPMDSNFELIITVVSDAVSRQKPTDTRSHTGDAVQNVVVMCPPVSLMLAAPVTVTPRTKNETLQFIDSLPEHERRYFSQNGEDGVIEAIFGYSHT
jgi:tetratricopeptide (TPR) repeat protein